MDRLHTYAGPFTRGPFVARPNRFTMAVRIDGRERSVYLRNSGGLGTVLDPGRTVLLSDTDIPVATD